MITNLPDTPVNSTVLIAAVGVFAVAGFFVKKSSDDRQHLANANLEAKRIDAQMQTEVITALRPKE